MIRFRTKVSAFGALSLLTAGFLSGQVDSTARAGVEAINRTLNNEKTGLTKLNNRLDDETTGLVKLNSRLNDEKTGLVKLNSRLDDEKTGLTKLNDRLGDADEQIKRIVVPTRESLHRFWVLIAAVLVFFMQAGFKCLEVGMSRRRNDAGVGVMNLMNWLVLCLVFYVCGFGLMFGTTKGGFIGSNHFFPNESEVLKTITIQSANEGTPPTGETTKDQQPKKDTVDLKLEFFLFQLAFAATAATIVDGAIAERTKLSSYVLVALVMATILYPVTGHWAWNTAGWLETGTLFGVYLFEPKYAFHDFAGSTVVHSVGAWVALTAVRFAGKRRPTPRRDVDDGRPFGLGYAVLGVIMLWFGWWGFNGGSTLQYNEKIAGIILNTNLAGAAAGLMAYWHASVYDRAHVNEKIIGGTLGGLVAITACCDVVAPWGAMLVGVAAGYFHNKAYDAIVDKFDDVAGAIPVHGICGVLGTLCAGLAMWGSDFQAKGIQLLVQLGGIVVVYLYTSAVSWWMLFLLDKYLGLRASREEEWPPRSGVLDGPMAQPGLAN